MDLLHDLLQRPPLAWLFDLTGLALLLAYHGYLALAFARQPGRTYRGHSDRLRRAWVRMVRASNKDILAVQTLRNWVMSATLFASTAIVIGVGVMSVAFQGLDLSAISQALSLTPTATELVRLKLLLIAGIFFGSFMHFALALRYYNHTGFLINLPDACFGDVGAAATTDGAGVGVSADTLNQAGGHYNRGTRGFLLALPFLLWLIGSDWFLGGVIVTLVMFWRFDFLADPDAQREADGGLGPSSPDPR